MKSQKTRLLLVVLGLFIATSSLMIVFATSELNIKSDLANAVQHIEKIIFRGNIRSKEGEEVTLTNMKNYAMIDTSGYNFVIDNNVDESNKNKIDNGADLTGNTILGGEKNVITGGTQGTLYNVIIAGENNKIVASSGATIGGGKNNKIEEGSDYSVIAGGSGNKIKGRYSSIPGGENNYISGEYSVAMGVNNVVEGNNSVALGSGSKVEADSSFLWTDGSHNDILKTDNTFAVVSKKGMVINRNIPHSFAKLTIGGSGSLIIQEGTDVVCDTNTKGVIKAVNKDGGDGVCLCSCNGTGWNSLYGGFVCGNLCSLGSSDPVCGSVKKICTPDHYTYSGSCDVGKVVEGNGAYFVDKDNKVHRSCQTEDGKVKDCFGEPVGDDCNHNHVRELCDFSTIGTPSLIERTCHTDFSADDIIEGKLFDGDQLEYACGPSGIRCVKVCKAGYVAKIQEGMQICDEKKCAGWFNGYYFPEIEGGFESTATKTGTTVNGSYSCTASALCRLGEFVEPFVNETCDYMCNAGTYSGYVLERDFAGGTYQTGSKSYVGSNGLTNCTAKFTCNNGVVEMSDEVCGIDGWCPSTTYTGEKVGVVNIPAQPNGHVADIVQGFSGLNGSCTLKFKCNDGQWDLLLEMCNFFCTPTAKPNGGIYGLSTFDDPSHTPTVWTYLGNGELKSCQYRCDDHHTWNSSTHECEGPKCTNEGNIPDENATINNDFTPSVNTDYYYSEDVSKPCTFSCDDGYTWNSSTRKCEAAKCIVPEGWEFIRIYGNSDQGLTENVNGRVYTHSEAENAINRGEKCVYVCDNIDYEPHYGHKACEEESDPCPTDGFENIGKCNVEGVTASNFTGSDSVVSWECGGKVCRMCSDGTRYYDDLENGGCTKKVVEVCRDITIYTLSTNSFGEPYFGWYVLNGENENQCYYGGTIKSISYSFKGTGIDIAIDQPIIYRSTVFYAPGAMFPRGFCAGGGITNRSYWGTNVSYRLDSDNICRRTGGIIDHFMAIETKKGITVIEDFTDIFLDEPTFTILSGEGYEIDFKDTCTYDYYVADTVYQCSGILPKGARLNDNGQVPIGGEEYICDAFGTGACAYHCADGYVCSSDGEGCEKSFADTVCGNYVFQCNSDLEDRSYGRDSEGYSLDEYSDPYYLSKNFTSWRCYDENGEGDAYNECYMSKIDIENQCYRGYLPSSQLNSVTQCGMLNNGGSGRILQGDPGYHIYDDEICYRCVKKSCPVGVEDGSRWRSDVSCNGEVKGYAGDSECRKCDIVPHGGPKVFHFDFLSDDPDFIECKSHQAVQICRDNRCRLNGELYYLGDDYFDYLWSCIYDNSDKNCKCTGRSR